MVNSMGAAILEGLFPNYCVLCGLRSHRPVPLCPPCESELQANSHCCRRCAIPLPPPRSESTGRPSPPGLCGRCLQSPPPFQRVVAPWLYCEGLAQIIHHWKFSGETRLTPLLAQLWLRQSPAPGPVDILLPVPLHWRRLWWRGFNQSELLARELRNLAPDIGAARLDYRSVRRRAGSAQALAGAAQRVANMQDAFTAHGRYANLRIAIIDDVLTTGATAAALARALHGAGASHVEVWCLARTTTLHT